MYNSRKSRKPVKNNMSIINRRKINKFFITIIKLTGLREKRGSKMTNNKSVINDWGERGQSSRAKIKLKIKNLFFINKTFYLLIYLYPLLSKNNCNRKYRHNRSTDSVDIFSRNKLMIIGE